MKKTLHHLLLLLLSLGFCAQVLASAVCHCPPATQSQVPAVHGQAPHSEHHATGKTSSDKKASATCLSSAPCCNALPQALGLAVQAQPSPAPYTQTPYLWAFAANYLDGLDRPPKHPLA